MSIKQDGANMYPEKIPDPDLDRIRRESVSKRQLALSSTKDYPFRKFLKTPLGQLCE